VIVLPLIGIVTSSDYLYHVIIIDDWIEPHTCWVLWTWCRIMYWA